jgi:hypothetical protein
MAVTKFHTHTKQQAINILIKAKNENILNEKNYYKVRNAVCSKWFSDTYKPTTAMSVHTWQNKSFLIPQITSNYMDIEYQHETQFLD